MSILIDRMFNDGSMDVNKQKVNKGWYIAKPLNYDKRYFPFRKRLADALRVLWGMSIAVHYKVDEESQP